MVVLIIASVMDLPGWGGDQLPDRFAGETGERKGEAAGLPQRHDPPPVEVKQLVQFHQIVAHGDERCDDDAAMHQVQHRQEQQRLVRRLVASVQTAPGAREREVKSLREVANSVMGVYYFGSRSPWKLGRLTP